jgi:hypothetical protein
MDSEQTSGFKGITTFHDLVKYLEDWQFINRIERGRTRLLSMQYIDAGSMEGTALEIGVTEWNGQLQVSLAPAGTFT